MIFKKKGYLDFVLRHFADNFYYYYYFFCDGRLDEGSVLRD